LYITHAFILVFKRTNGHDIERRSKNGLALIINFPILLLLGILYGLSIENQILPVCKAGVLIGTITIFLLVRYLVFRRYAQDYDKVIREQTERHAFSSATVIVAFTLLWFGSVFVFWAGILLFKGAL
jgi:hypothetical protein